MIYVKCTRTLYKRKQFIVSIVAMVKIRFQIYYSTSNTAKEIPPALIIHTIKCRLNMRHRCAWRLPYRTYFRFIIGTALIGNGLIKFFFVEENLGVGEMLTGVTKTFGCLGFTKPINVNALLAYPSS